MVLRNIASIALLFVPVIALPNPTTFEIGKTKINISIPEGYCILDKSDPSDNRVLTTFDRQAKGKHRRLAFMMNCDQLVAWRKGDILTFDDFGYILLPEEYVDQNEDKVLARTIHKHARALACSLI